MTTNRLREVDLERGMPTMRAALQQLSFELRRGRSLGCAAVKLIHGYGSSGKGGRIRVEARACLARMKERGELRDVIPGEEFTIFEPRTLAAFQRCPDLRKDPDLERHNNGITVVVLEKRDRLKAPSQRIKNPPERSSTVRRRGGSAQICRFRGHIPRR